MWLVFSSYAFILFFLIVLMLHNLELPCKAAQDKHRPREVFLGLHGADRTGRDDAPERSGFVGFYVPGMVPY